MYWGQGWDRAPLLVKKCKESWLHYNPEWTVHALDANSLRDHFDLYRWMPCNDNWQPSYFQDLKEQLHQLLHSTRLIKHKKIKIQALSDIIRINLLHQYGGVWVDATAWCHRPLDEWLTPLSKGFFCFCDKEDPSVISSWFLAAHKNNYVVDTFHAEVEKYWSKHDKATEYFWFHSIFKELYENNEEFQSLWSPDKQIDNSIGRAYGPCYFAPYHKEKMMIFDAAYKQMIDSDQTPVFKLSNQKKMPLENYDSIKYLFDTIAKG